MNRFYQLLLNRPITPTPYLTALIQLTNASHEQMKMLVSDLAWQQWTETESA